MTRQLGRKPILTFGNSSGDYPMFEFVTTGNSYQVGSPRDRKQRASLYHQRHACRGTDPWHRYQQSSEDYQKIAQGDIEFTKNHTLRVHKLLHQDLYEYLNIKKALAVKNVLHPICPRKIYFPMQKLLSANISI